MSELHRVACTGMGGRDPAVREIDIEQLIHISHDDHVTIEENDPLEGVFVGLPVRLEDVVPQNPPDRIPCVA